MKATIVIDMDGAAFEDAHKRGIVERLACWKHRNELGWILRRLGNAFMDGRQPSSGRLLDSNGNMCGRFEITEE